MKKGDSQRVVIHKQTFIHGLSFQWTVFLEADFPENWLGVAGAGHDGDVPGDDYFPRGIQHALRGLICDVVAGQDGPLALP